MRALAVAVATASVLAAPALSAADWAVKRAGSGDLVTQAARAFSLTPDDRGAADRLARAAGKARLPTLLPQFRQRAEDEPSSYVSVEAYARLLLLAGQPDEATGWFVRAAALRPTSVAAPLGQAAALRAAGDPHAALDAYDRALVLTTAPAQRRRILDQMLALLGDATDVEREIAVRKQLLPLAPRDTRVADGLIDALVRAGRPDEGARLLQGRLADGRGDRVSLSLRIVDLHESAGDDDKAAALLSELRTHLSGAAADRRRTIWSRALDVARKRGQLPALARELTQSTGATAIEWEILSHVRDELGDADGALAAAHRAAAAAPRDLPIRQWIAALLDRLGRPEEAATQYEEMTRLAPRDLHVARELLDRRFHLGPVAAARSAFDQIAARFSRQPAALADLAQLASRWSEEQRATQTWERLHRLAPDDETAIIGLGEMYFQRGKKESALKTWRELGRPSPARHLGKADAQLRLADVLMEHDLFDEALAAARLADQLEPHRPSPHRTLAQLMERQRKVDAAIAEWELFLDGSSGPGHAGERYEARSRILAMAAREGRGRLAQRVSRLEEQARAHPQDREAATFLAEAQQRSGNLAGAIATLRRIVESDRALTADYGASKASAGAGDSARADTVLTLVRLLRQARLPDEAAKLLEDVVVRFPARAREAHVQMADLELGRYNDTRALQHAQAADRLSPGDSQALVRIAAIEERAGHDEQALATYRRASAKDGNPAAQVGLARLLERRGEPREAAQALRAVLRTASDEDVIADIGRRAIDVEEYLGTLDDLERLLAVQAYAGGGNAPAYRRLLVDVLKRLVPAIYRDGTSDAAAAAVRARLAQHGLRPLLEQIADSEGNPEAALLELGGMLGNPDAAPVLARLAQEPPPTSLRAGTTDGPPRPGVPTVSEAQLAATMALARLRDERARPTLEQLAIARDAGLRAAAVWGLGRLGNLPSTDVLRRAMADASDDVAALACLGLGRLRDEQAIPALVALAAEPARTTRVRRAAVLALGLAGDRAATAPLLALLDSGDATLATDAATALGAIADPRAVEPLIERVLMGRDGPGASLSPSLAALQRFRPGRGSDDPRPDEGRALDGPRVNVDRVLEALFAAPGPGAAGPLAATGGPLGAAVDGTDIWLDHLPAVEAVIERGLKGNADQKRRLLLALDARADGIGLGALVSDLAPSPLPGRVAAALQRMGTRTRPLVSDIAEHDATPDLTARALRVLAKLPGPAPGAALIARVVQQAGSSPWNASGAAAVFAAGATLRRHPEAAPNLLAAIAPLLAHPAWQVRLAAVEVLRATGKLGYPTLGPMLADRNALVRAAAASGAAATDGEP